MGMCMSQRMVSSSTILNDPRDLTFVYARSSLINNGCVVADISVKVLQLAPVLLLFHQKLVEQAG